MIAAASPTLALIRRRRGSGSAPLGDCAPFSLLRPNGAYVGADIDMAFDLAARLGVGLAFVATMWCGLLDDFLAGRFDIAMGGVTVMPARAEQAFFSIPNFVDGKRPGAGAGPRSLRHPRRDRSPGVRLIANPGSANEALPAPIPAREGDHPPRQRHRLRRVRPRQRRRHGHRRARSRPPGAIPSGMCAVPVAAPFTRLEKAYFFARDR